MNQFTVGDATLYNGDCLEEMKRISDDSVDMVFTSPPYADRRKKCYEGKHVDEYVVWFKEIAIEIKRILKDTGSFFLNIKPHCDKGERSLYVMELILALKKDIGFRFVDEFVWTKLGVPGRFKGRFKNAFEPIYHFSISKDFIHNPYTVASAATDVSLKRYKRKACGTSTNGSGFAGMRKEIKNRMALPSNHLHIPQKSNQHTVESKHPAVFPVDLPTFFIKAFSLEHSIILDPFMGSGTTGVACANLSRQFIGIELDQKYFNISVGRIAEAHWKKGVSTK